MVETTRMKFITAEVHSKILNQALFDQISKVKFLDGQYEEIPLVSRYSSVEFLQRYFCDEEVSLYLASIAQRLLLDSEAYFRKIYSSMNEKRLFSCLTFVDFDDEVDDVGFCIPNMFFSTSSTVKYLASSLCKIENSGKFGAVYASILEKEEVKVYRTTTAQGGINTDRIYLVF